MRGHSSNELRTTGDVLGPDYSFRAQGVYAGVFDLSGKRLEEAQLVTAETTHMVLFHAADVTTLDNACYLSIDGATYVVDYITDPRVPRPGMWTEVYCHAVDLQLQHSRQ